MKLGWKFELLNKLSGEKSGALKLTEEQKYDICSKVKSFVLVYSQRAIN